MQSLTFKRGSRQAKKQSKRAAIARLMESLENRTLLSTTDWLAQPTAELRQPTPTSATQIALQTFPPATVVSNGSLQYTTSWVANSYGGYDQTSPDGGTVTYNMVNISSQGVAAGPQAADGTYLMGLANGYAEEGQCLTVYQDGAPLSGNDIATSEHPGSGGGRGVVFGDSHAPYVYESMNEHDKDTGVEYYTVLRFNRDGTAADFVGGVSNGQNAFGVNTLSGQPNYMFSNADNKWQPTSLGYFYNTSTSTPTLYVSDNLDNSIYIFNAVTGAPIATPGVNGVILNPASTGNYTVTVTDSGINKSITSGNINVVKTAITTTSLMSTTVTSVAAGTAFNYTVTAYKSDGTVDTGYTGTVAFTSTDGQVSAGNGLPSNYTFVAGDAGVKTFSVTLKTAGNQTITATDSTNGLQAVSTTPTTVLGAATATSFSVSTVTSIEKNNNFVYTLTAKDAYGNAALGYTGTVHFTSTDGTATLPGDYHFLASDKGVYTVTSGLKFGSTGSYTVTATDTVNGTLTVTTSPAITVVTNDTTNSYTVTGVPTQTTAGSSFNITVTAKKADGVTTDTTNTRTIQLTTTDPWINSHGGLPSHALVAGTYTFSVTLDTAGSQTITATDVTDQGDTTTTSPITVVNTGSVDHLAITTPTIVHAGSSFNVKVSAQDLYNNPVTSYTGTVSFTASSGSNPSLPAAYTFIAADKGVRSFIGGTLAIADPYDMAFDNNGYLWVASSTGGVAQYNASTGARTGKSIAGLPAATNSIAWDTQRGTSGELAVAISGPVGASAASIRFWDVSGTPTQTGTFGSSVYSGTPGEMGVSKLSNIVDIDFDAAGQLYVATASHNGFGSAEVRVLSLSGYPNPTGTLAYAEIGRTAGASATPVSYTDNQSVYHDELYTMDGQFSMNYNAAPGDQWTWTGLTFQPGLFSADTRSLSNISSAANTPIVRYINGNKYMYLVGQGNYLEVYKQDASSYLFRPVAMISTAKGDVIGDGTGSFENYLEPTSNMWIWTDANGNGAFDSGEFNTYSGTGTQFAIGMGDVFPDNAGNLFFSVNKAYGDSNYGPAIVEMSPTNWTNNIPTYNFNDNTHTLRTLLPTNDTGLPGSDVAWGQTGGKANNAGYIAYDQANDILYMAGGPSDNEGGQGMVLRAYKNWSTISHDGVTGLGDLTNYNNDPTHLAWSISPSWINVNDPTKAMHVITAAGGYVFVESRGDVNYVYNGIGSSGGTLAGEIHHTTMTTINAFPDNTPPFQAIQRPSGDIILTSEGFFTEPLYRIMAGGDHSPTASFSQDVITSATSPVTVTFKAAASDPDGDTLTYNWQFGDGTFDHSNSPTVTHTYTYNGGFTVDLAVGDNKGGYAEAASTVTAGPATTSFTNVAPTVKDASLSDTDPTGDGAGVCDTVTSGGTIMNIGGNSNGTSVFSPVFPFDLWAHGLRPGDHVSAANLPTLSFVLNAIYGAPSSADLYAIAMENTVEATFDHMAWMYYAGSGDTSPSAVMLQQNFLTSTSPVGSRITINPAAALALANYINAALDAGNRFIVLRLSPQSATASTNYYTVNASESGATAPQLSVTTLPLATVSNTSNYGALNNALAAGLSQYGNSTDSGVTFTTIPAKYLGASYIRTDNGDKATSTVNGSTLQFTINQTATVYVAYDDALSAHKPAWLTSGFTDTTDNIVTTAGTFSVYKNNADYAAGLVSLGANTSDGSSIGHMYSVLVAPPASQAANLVAWWKFDEGTGTAVTDVAPSGASANNGTVTTGSGTINGVPVWGDGYQGNAQQFDINLPGSAGGPSPVNLGQSGTALHLDGSDYLSIADNADLRPASNISVSLWAANDVWEKAWADRNGWNGQSDLICGPNFYIQPQATFVNWLGNSVADGQDVIFAVNTSLGLKSIRFTPKGNDPSDSNHIGKPYQNDFNLFQWHQYGLTFSTASSGTLTAYVDGRVVGTLTNCGTLNTTAGSLVIGADGSGNNRFAGSIDDVRIYNTALTTTNMQALGNLGAGVSAVDGSPAAKGAAAALKVTGVTGMAAAAVTIAKTTDATEGGTTGVFTVTRTGSTASALTVNYVVGGSATNGTDYTSLPGTVTIASGSSTATINVSASADGLAELTETVDLTIVGGAGYSVGSPNYATVTIANNAADTANFLDSSYLKGYWRFDEGSGTTMYDSAPVTADNGTATSVNAWVPGRVGNALYMNASANNVITIPDSNGNLHSASMSVALWAQSGAANWNKSSALIIGNNNFEILPVASSKTVTFGVYAGSTFQTVSYTPTFDITLWHQYGLTYNDSTKLLTAYVDGASVGTLTVSGARPTVASTVTLGKLNTAYFKGTLDEVRFYNTNISTADISTLYNQGVFSVAIAGVSGSHISSYGIASGGLKVGAKLYGDVANTISTLPGNSGKYIGSTLLTTANADAASTGNELLGVTVTQNSIVYVLYDDAITTTHRADYNGGWLSKLTDTGDNITDSSGHTFSVYKANVSAGTIWLGGNTSDGVNGTGLMYDVFVQPLL